MSSKTNTLGDGLIQGTSSMLEDKLCQKPCINTKKVIYRGKRNKILSKVKPVKNISKNPKCFLEISPERKKNLPSHKLQDHACE